MELNCLYCRGNLKVCANGIDCGYSKTPNKIPKYKVGDLVYYKGLQYKIRKVEWDGHFEWEYTFARERTPHCEKTIFNTKRECDEYNIKEQAKRLYNQMVNFCDRYHIPLEEYKKNLLELK